ncbi:MAG: OmpA family protein [Flavobacteriales bacterium]|nr:OmpA family protein [Flavobacteriales bacterium]
MKNVRRTLSLLIALWLIHGQAAAQFVTEKAISGDENASDMDQKMQLEIWDSGSRTGIEADVTIKGINPRKDVVFKNITDTIFEIKKYRQYTVSCVKKGYMYYAHKFWPDEMALHVESIKLQPLQVGLKTDIEDITFLGDETKIYEKSEGTLQELVTFLNENPTVQIMIIGHGNGPDIKIGDARIMKATLQRAETVKKYLVDHGIDESRLTTKGAGNTKMRFSDPETDWQAEANRRIEIEITSL